MQFENLMIDLIMIMIIVTKNFFQTFNQTKFTIKQIINEIFEVTVQTLIEFLTKIQILKEYLINETNKLTIKSEKNENSKKKLNKLIVRDYYYKLSIKSMYIYNDYENSKFYKNFSSTKYADTFKYDLNFFKLIQKII